MTGLAGTKCGAEHSEGLFKLAPRMWQLWAFMGSHVVYVCIIIIIYLSWSWATCWPILVSCIPKSVQRSTMISSASWGVVFHYPWVIYFEAFYLHVCMFVCVCVYIYFCSWFAVSSRVKMKFGWSLLSSTPLTPLRSLKYISQHVCIIAYVLGLLAWLFFQDLLLFALESISGEYEQMTSECSTPWLLLLMLSLGSKFCIDYTEVN